MDRQICFLSGRRVLRLAGPIHDCSANATLAPEGGQGRMAGSHFGSGGRGSERRQPLCYAPVPPPITTHGEVDKSVKCIFKGAGSEDSLRRWCGWVTGAERTPYKVGGDDLTPGNSWRLSTRVKHTHTATEVVPMKSKRGLLEREWRSN